MKVKKEEISRKMSSVHDKSNGALKNLFLLRRASIDKIKCTAYPILGK